MNRIKAQLESSLVNFLTDLIAIPTTYPPGDTENICKYVEERLKPCGYQIDHYMSCSPTDNLIARIDSVCPSESPSIAFNVHVDTVEPGSPAVWEGDPYQAHIRDGRLYGLGSTNCKGSMALHIWLAEEIYRRGGIKRGSLTFSFVGDEEALGPNGTKMLRDKSVLTPDILIVGAPTSNDLLIDERGVMWLRLTAHGTGGHAGDPASADNAIDRLVRLLSSLEIRIFQKLSGRKQGDISSTVNVGKIYGGTNTNVVPERAAAEIDRRLLPSECVSEALAEIQTALDESGEPKDSYELELLVGTNGFRGKSTGFGVNAFSEAITKTLGRDPNFLTPVGAFDGRHFAADNIEIINTGPGESSEGHGPNESILITELTDAAEIHINAIESLVGFNS